MTTWSRVTRLGPVFTSMADELEVVECEDGRRRYDVPGAPYVDGDAHAPVRLLGDLRQRVALACGPVARSMAEVARRRWMGANGGNGGTVFVDGFMAGLWWWRDGAVALDVPGSLTRSQRAELAEETDRVTVLLRG